MLAIRIDTGLSSNLLRLLAFDKHFEPLEGELAGCLQLHLPATETANGVPRMGIISAPHAALLRLFVERARPKLNISKRSAFLFPSVNERPLTEISISHQQNKFLKARMGQKFAPEVIRKLLSDRVLRHNPMATGVLSAALGLGDKDYVAKLAAPYLRRQRRGRSAGLVVSGALK